MRILSSVTLAAVSLFLTARTFCASMIIPASVTVGKNLQAPASISLTDAAPKGGLAVTLTSSDPAQLLLSARSDAIGTRSITVTVPDGRKVSHEFFIQALGDSGSVTYTASAPGWERGTGAVTLARSGIVIAGPTGLGNLLITVVGAPPVKINVQTAVLDSARGYAGEQQVRGGWSVNVEVTCSNPKVGAIAGSPVAIEGGSSTASAQFQTVGAGEVTLAPSVPAGFSPPANFAKVSATVRAPGMAVTDDLTIGQNLQAEGTVVLGRPAPPGGLAITIASDNPDQLLISTGATTPGSGSIALNMPAGATIASYRLQALANSGTVAYRASAPGYVGRSGKVTLTPSGVLVGMFGPPDEAELFHKEVADAPHGFVTPPGGKKTTIMVYTAQLHPVHHRAADITLQSLRAGLSLTVHLKSSNPAVGTVASPVTIQAGSMEVHTEFTALTTGTTDISVDTPPGFTTAGNATFVTAIVKQ